MNRHDARAAGTSSEESVATPIGMLAQDIAADACTRNGPIVEDLSEPQAPPDVVSSYRTPEELAWARRWPMENLWELRKA